VSESVCAAHNSPDRLTFALLTLQYLDVLASRPHARGYIHALQSRRRPIVLLQVIQVFAKGKKDEVYNS